MAEARYKRLLSLILYCLMKLVFPMVVNHHNRHKVCEIHVGSQVNIAFYI